MTFIVRIRLAPMKQWIGKTVLPVNSKENMTASTAWTWKRRLAIVLSGLWIVVWALLYVNDPYKSMKDSITGMILLGVLPVAIPWASLWVWHGFARGEKPPPSTLE